MARLRIDRWAFLLGVMLLPYVGPAFGQSDICNRLEARLTALDSRAVVTDDQKSQALEKSIRDEQAKLDRATAEARRAGCMGFFQRLAASAACGSTMAAIDRMRANLNRLTAARRRADEQPSSGGERRDLIDALAANRCGADYEDYAVPTRSNNGLFASLFGRRWFSRRGWGDPFGTGTYRTLCVRTCDGYYFPISFTTVQARFARDEQLCRSMCPGTEVALYVHRNPGEDSDAMVSLAGEPYAALPTAFRYRTKYDSACQCGKIAASPIAVSEPVTGYLPSFDYDPWSFARGADSAEPPAGDSPVPLPRPAAGEDPETLANRAGDLVPATNQPPTPAVARLTADGERHVRIVGPSYFFSQ